ncbi:hypothetical protein [Dinghuibacter silviterrae]|uniref:FkbM family methyltransferase n=1 Tax=Dinghuibacter silviterrae TaxID=1539049 RepID=A0A4R8DSD7_9BACT|nr:hypothetical protein [Dinghuibacter silviterrae]TDX00959.1 hypothetical protein EDB95_1990 [Dinghuibacter silviterrae]
MPPILTYLAKRFAYPLFLRGQVNPALQVQLRLLQASYRDRPDLTLAEREANVFTYHGEDGLLLFLVTHLPSIPRVFIDVGAGDCVKGNTALYAVHFGWSGLFIDADPRNIAIGRAFYGKLALTKFAPPRFLCTTVTPGNVSSLLPAQEVGLLSIDIDGEDYWVWDAIHQVRPWIVIIEAKIELGAASVVGRYGTRGGASVPALCRLAEAKGYALVAYNRQGYNLIFLRTDLLGGALRALDPGALLADPAVAACFLSPETLKGPDYLER